MEPPTHVVGVGASAGGVDALTELVQELPANSTVAVCVVLHVPATGRSLLAPILDRRSAAQVTVAADGEPLAGGRVYVAPADRHLTVHDGHLQLDRGPKENGVRPAVDPMLRSLADAYGERAVAVVLSGALGDGSSGALAVRRAGGRVVVQDPEEATVPSMPETALRAVGSADAVLPARAIGTAIARLGDEAPRMREDEAMAPTHRPVDESQQRPDGPPSVFTCPECHGTLWELEDGNGVLRYRCRVGHQYSEDAMIIEQGSAVEAALWSALEALEERAEFLRRMAARHGDERPRLRRRYDDSARDALERADLIRTALGARRDGPGALDLQMEAAE